MPQLNGSITPSVVAAATAASALAPLFRMASAACDPRALIVATVPPVPVVVGVLAMAREADAVWFCRVSVKDETYGRLSVTFTAITGFGALARPTGGSGALTRVTSNPFTVLAACTGSAWVR